MFPLVHWYFGKRMAAPSSLLALGGTLPDLGGGMGLERNRAHVAGKELYAWCKQEAPELLPAAQGMIVHGVDPKGVDYYADEAWSGGERGWCFQLCEPFVPQVIKACALPEKWGLWKGHNFVEMAMELVVKELEPSLSDELMQASADKGAIDALTAGLKNCFDLEEPRIRQMLGLLPVIFSIEDTTAQSLAQHYKENLARMYDIQNSDVSAMTELLLEIKETYQKDFTPWATIVEEKVREDLTAFEKTFIS